MVCAKTSLQSQNARNLYPKEISHFQVSPTTQSCGFPLPNTRCHD